MKKQQYMAPMVEEFATKVEMGFQASGDGYSDNWEMDDEWSDMDGDDWE